MWLAITYFVSRCSRLCYKLKMPSVRILPHKVSAAAAVSVAGAATKHLFSKRDVKLQRARNKAIPHITLIRGCSNHNVYTESHQQSDSEDGLRRRKENDKTTWRDTQSCNSSFDVCHVTDAQTAHCNIRRRTAGETRRKANIIWWTHFIIRLQTAVCRKKQMPF